MIVTAVFLHDGYLWWQHRLAPDTDILALLPAQQRDPMLQRGLAHMVDAAQQRLVVLIGAPAWEDALSAAAAYRKALAPFRHLMHLADSMTDSSETNWLAIFKNHRLALLTPQDDAALAQRGMIVEALRLENERCGWNQYEVKPCKILEWAGRPQPEPRDDVRVCAQRV